MRIERHTACRYTMSDGPIRLEVPRRLQPPIETRGCGSVAISVVEGRWGRLPAAEVSLRLDRGDAIGFLESLADAFGYELKRKHTDEIPGVMRTRPG
jgi:hypothetical protein